MNAVPAIGNTPVWNYGKNASFGLFARPLKGEKLLLLLYKGVVFKRKTTFLWKNEDEEESGGEESGGEESGGEGKCNLSFKQRIEPRLVVVPASGAVVGRTEFPITLFLSDEVVVYSSEELKTFKKLKQIDEEEFYALKEGEAATAFSLPELEENVYDEDEDTIENTKKGLLFPLWYISVGKNSVGALFVKEVLNVQTENTFAFEEDVEKDDEEETEEDPCKPGDGGPGPDGTEDATRPGGAPNEEGSDDEEGESSGEKPCEED